MTSIGVPMLVPESQLLQMRLVTFLDQTLPPHDRAKMLARRIGCSVRYARNILIGHNPAPQWLLALVREFGTDCRDALFGPEIDAKTAGLKADIRQLQDALHEKEKALRALAGGAEADPELPLEF